jgi:hypothetical protein
MMAEFSSKIAQIEEECTAARERYLEKNLQRVETILSENWILNNDREYYGSDEEGAI